MPAVRRASREQVPALGSRFVYPVECERGTNSRTFRLKKLRAYHQFIVKQKKHRQVWGIRRVHAVLIETPNHEIANDLWLDTIHPSIRGLDLFEDGFKPDAIQEQRRQNASPLFRVTHSEMYAENQLVGDRTLPLFVRQPDIIFDKIWRKPREPHEAITLLDL